MAAVYPSSEGAVKTEHDPVVMALGDPFSDGNVKVEAQLSFMTPESLSEKVVTQEHLPKEKRGAFPIKLLVPVVKVEPNEHGVEEVEEEEQEDEEEVECGYQDQITMKEEVTIEEHSIDPGTDTVEEHHFPQSFPSPRDRRALDFSSGATSVERTLSVESCYVCVTCNQNFLNRSQLTTHMSIHAGEKAYSSPKCNKRSSVRSHLTQHMLTDTEKKVYSCDECNKRFSQSSNLKRHMLTHTREKAYSCEVCKKSFTLRDSLIRHFSTHSREKRYSCTECNKSFSRHYSLTLHMMTHTRENAFSCTVCNKNFSQPSNLKRHMLAHTG